MKRSSYTPSSRAAKTVVEGRTFRLAPPMRKGGQQPKAAPRAKAKA